MKPQCVDAVQAALGRTLLKGESEAIEQRLLDQMRALARTDPAWHTFTRAEKLRMAGEGAAKQLLQEAALKRRRVALQVQAQIDRTTEMETIAAARPGRTLFNGLAEVIRRTDVFATGIHRDTMSRLMDLLEAAEPKFWQVLGSDPAFTKALVFEAFGRDTGNAAAARAAKRWLQVIEDLRERFNRAGGDVGRLMYAYFPHAHDMLKVLDAGKDVWVSKVLPLLDRRQYVDENGRRLDDEEVRAFLGGAWETISSDGLNKLEPGMSPPGVSGLIANRGSQSRQIHFAGPEEYLAYMNEFGRGTVLDAMMGHIRHLSRNIAIVERFGPNAEATFNLLHDTAKTTRATDRMPARHWWVSTREMWDTLTGYSSSVYDGGIGYVRAAERWQAVRDYQVAAKLQATLFSAISDFNTFFSTTHFYRMPVYDSARMLLAGFTSSQARDMAKRMGMVSESLAYDLGRWGTDMLRDRWAGRIANTTMKVSLLNAFTDAVRRASGMAMMGALGKIHAKDWSHLERGDRARLGEQGIDERTWAVWRLAKLEDWEGVAMLTPEAVRALPDAALAPFGDPKRVRDTAITKLVGFLVDESHYASLAPDIYTRARVESFGQLGELRGELPRTMLQFKTFPMALISRHWTRAIDHWHFNDGIRKASYTAGIGVGMTLFGGLIVLLKDIAAGRDPRDTTTSEFWGLAAMSGGGFSFLGNAMYNMLSGGSAIDGQSSQSQAAGAVLGPALGAVFDFGDLTLRNLGQAARGEDADLGAEAFRFVRSNTPFVNLWYTRTVLDRALLHDVQEILSPGYLQRMERRARREYGTEYWWSPGESLPDRAPDLTTIGGR